MIVWNDETAYVGDISEPLVYVAIIGEFRLAVHRNIFHPGKWMFSCYEIQIENEKLESADVTEAQKQALQMFSEAAIAKAEDLKDAAQFATAVGA